MAKTGAKETKLLKIDKTRLNYSFADVKNQMCISLKENDKNRHFLNTKF